MTNRVPIAHVPALRLSVPVAMLAAVGLTGCAPQSSPFVSAGAVTTVRPRTTASVASEVPTSVQSLPEYAQAKAACRQGNYRKAAQILAILERSNSLTVEQRSFCRAQEQICRNHFTKPTAVPAINASLPARSPRLALFASDCGPRALLLACQKLGVPASLPALTEAAGTNRMGTDFRGLKAAAEKFQLKAEGVQTSREALPDLPMPALAWWHGNHFIVVLALQGREENGQVTVRDPNETQERTISQEQLLQSCSGYLLTLRK